MDTIENNRIFEQDFPEIDPTEEEMEAAVNILINAIDEHTELTELEFLGDDGEVVELGSRADVNGTAEQGDYDDFNGATTHGLEEVEYSYAEEKLTEHLEAAIQEANSKLAAIKSRIAFKPGAAVEDLREYEVEDIVDYDVESGDDGIGSYEYWGFKGYDSKPYTIAVNISWTGYATFNISVAYSVR